MKNNKIPSSDEQELQKRAFIEKLVEIHRKQQKAPKKPPAKVSR
jgi:hypothetical protein